MNWNGVKVLVTGSGGFIGSHLCEELISLGADITAMIHYNSRSNWGNLGYLPKDYKKNIKVLSGNIEDSYFVAESVNGKEVVFHLAALISIPYSYLSPISNVRTNVEGTLNVMEASRNFGVKKIVHTSTSETYGTAIYTPIDEKHPLQGQSPYSASKIGGDKIAESYHLSYNLPVATIRPFNVYGPRQSARAIIPAIISQALTRDVVRLGDLAPIRDFTFVKDTVRGFIQIAESDKTAGETINIGSGQGITIANLVKKILTLMNCDKQILQENERFRPDKSEVYTLLCNNSKALDLIGWKPDYSFDRGLQETIAFVSDNIDEFKSDLYVI